MFQKNIKKLSVALMAVSASFMGCSETESVSDPFGQNSENTVYLKNTATNMWARIQEEGVSEYFETLSDEGKPIVSASAIVDNHCDAPALKMDDNTRYFDELETLFDEGEQVEGVCGKALKLNDGQVAPLGVNLIDSMSVGTVEFWFRPNEDFYDKSARTLFGNDGARIHFFYKDGKLYFQKNHADIHYYVGDKVSLKDDWNLIAGQWGDGYMSLWVNGELVARTEHDLGYVPANRGKAFENLLVIGYKSGCCMEGPGQFESMTTSGSYDQVRISNIVRNKVVEESEDIDLDTNWVVDYEFNDPKMVGRDFSGHDYHAVVAEGEVAVDSGFAYFDGKSGLRLAEGKNISLSDFVVEARVYPEDVSGFRNILVTEPPGYGPDGWIFRFENGSLMFYVRDADWSTDWKSVSVDNVKTNQWYDIRVECTTKSVRLFLNGELKAEKAISGNYSSLQYPWGVGFDAVYQSIHDRYFKGYMDYVRVGKLETEETPVETPVTQKNCMTMDDKTLYLEELESEFEAGEQIEGVCGKGLSLNPGEKVSLGINLLDSMAAGTVEFWFRPNADFYDEPRSLFGNDGARVHFFYKDGEIFFQKNHHNLHYYARGKVTFKNDWNLIAGQWGDGYMSIWVNGEMVALLKHDLGYVPADRGIEFENLLVIGYKSACCMPSGNSVMYTSGAYDQIRISSAPRYKVEVKEEQEEAAKDSTVGVDTNPVIAIIDTVITVDTVFVEKKPVVDTTIYVKPYVEKIDTTWIPVVNKCCMNADDLIIKEPIELDITDSL